MKSDRPNIGRCLCVAILVVLVLQTGCQSFFRQLTDEAVHPAALRPWSPEEMKAVNTGKESIALFRMTTTNGRTNESLRLTGSVRWNIWRLDDQQKPKVIADSNYDTRLQWRIPSEADGRMGWRYLLLRPGTYFMEVIPDEGVGFGYPTYRVVVPAGHPVVYAGSFPFSKVKKAGIGQISTFQSEGVMDETDLARAIVLPGVSNGPALFTSRPVLSE